MNVEAPHPFPPRYMRSSAGGEKGKKENSTWAALGSGGGAAFGTQHSKWAGRVVSRPQLQYQIWQQGQPTTDTVFPRFPGRQLRSQRPQRYSVAIKNRTINRTWFEQELLSVIVIARIWSLLL